MPHEDSSGHPFLSIVMPAHNEAGCVAETCRALAAEFGRHNIEDYEILVVNDHSRDETGAVLQSLAAECPALRVIANPNPGGYGYAVRAGLAEYRGDAVAVVMADGSDAPADVVAYYRALKEGAECVFGSRFIPGGRVIRHPAFKRVLNRLANGVIRFLFQIPHNDITNAFKAYRREVIDGIQPLFSNHFNLTVEMPLKAIVRGFRHVRLPISWTNRKAGESKLKIKEMGSRYLFIILYC